MSNSKFNTDLTRIALMAVLKERVRQVELGRTGKIPHPCEYPLTSWLYKLGVLVEEVGEVSTALIENKVGFEEEVMDELIQVAAVAVACVEGQLRLMPNLQRRYDLKLLGVYNTPDATTDDSSEKRQTIFSGSSPSGFENMSNELSDEHMEVLHKAHKLYKKRNASYQDVWKDYGWRGCVFQVRTEAARAFRVLWNAQIGSDKSAKGLDALLDLINYAVFCYRNIEMANRDGTWEYK